MYFLERREPYTMPNILGNRSFPIRTYRWRIIMACKEKEPLEEIIRKSYTKAAEYVVEYRITSNHTEGERA